MAVALRRFIGALLLATFSLAEEKAEVAADIGTVGVLNNLIEMNVELFEELVAANDETRVRHD